MDKQISHLLSRATFRPANTQAMSQYTLSIAQTDL